MARQPSEVAASTEVRGPEKSLLRFLTCGSVDDGKSTLIGRLLYDSKLIQDDQLDALRRDSRKHGTTGDDMDLALLVDGLEAEREQGITIDVAYRYFSSARRKFIIADTPGHEQYTRNMATGASTADAAVVLMDATKGVLRQSRRHAHIATLLGVPHLIAAVNKMDLVDFSQEIFHRIADEFQQFANQLGVRSLYAVPVSALDGDNVVRRSPRTPWFQGSTLLEHLETLRVSDDRSAGPLRLPIQYVIRPNSSFRGFAGQIASGALRPGTPVMALPSGLKTRVKSIVTFGGELETAGPGTSVNVTLADEIDLSRGDILVDEVQAPWSGKDFRATLVWMHADPLDVRKTYLLKHTTRTVHSHVKQLLHRIDVNTLDKAPAAALEMNDIAEVEIQTAFPLFFDAYRVNRTLGSFILIDRHTNATVAAGTIERPVFSSVRSAQTPNLGRTTREEHVLRFGHPAAGLWLQERPDVAERVERRLFEEGWHVHLAGPADFHAHEIVAAAKAYFLSGSIAIFALADEEASQVEAVRAIFGRDAFFTFEGQPENDDDATDRIVDQLYKWRDAHSGSRGDSK